MNTVFELFSWFGHGRDYKPPAVVSNWPVTHRGQWVASAETAGNAGAWLALQLGNRFRLLGEATYDRYVAYVPDVIDRLERGNDSMCWAIWAADRRSLLSLAVVRFPAVGGVAA